MLRGSSLPVALAVLVLGCDTPLPFDRAAMLREAAATQILPGYADAAEAARDLSTATDALCAAPGPTTLEAAHDAWRDAALAWRATRPFEVRSEGTIGTTLEGELTTTADVAAIESVATGTDPIDVPAQGGATRGFAALEYLLFAHPAYAGPDPARTLAALADARRCAYARALAADVADVVARAHDAWRPEAGDFAATFVSPGTSATYPTVQGPTGELLSALVNAIDHARDLGVGRPLGLTAHDGGVESPYARASVALMRAAVAAARRLWTEPPHGFDAMLRARDPRLADEVLAELDAAVAALDALASPPLAPPWEDYVSTSDHAAGEAAYDALAALVTTLSTDVSITLGASVWLMVDGD